MIDREACLRKLSYFDRLTDGERQMISEYWVERSYKKGQLIHACNRECLGQMLVLTGEIRTFILSEEGREVTLFRLRPNDTCVLAASCVISQITFETQMVAVEDTTVLILSASLFERLMNENIYVRCYLYESLSARLNSAIFTLQQILFTGFDRRLASFLLSEYERTGSREIKMTHEQIAQDTGSAREVVARMLKRFSTEGLVEFRRGTVTLKDIDGLKYL